MRTRQVLELVNKAAKSKPVIICKVAGVKAGSGLQRTQCIKFYDRHGHLGEL